MTARRGATRDTIVSTTTDISELDAIEPRSGLLYWDAIPVPGSADRLDGRGMMPGLVSLPHGWSHVDTLSGNAAFSGIVVRLERV